MSEFRIRDAREPGHFRIDTILIRGGWARALGPYGLAVYTALCCSANNDTQEAKSKYQTIADSIGCSRRQVIDSVADLEAARLIKIEFRKRRNGTQTSNEIILLHRDEWFGPDIIEQRHQEKRAKQAAARKTREVKNRQGAPDSPGQGAPDSPGQGAPDSPGQGAPDSPHELDSMDLTNLTEGRRDAAPPAPGAEISGIDPESTQTPNAVIPVNPTIESPAQKSPPRVDVGHPAIAEFRTQMERWPRKNQFADIAAAVGEKPADVGFWGQVVGAWKLTGWNPLNVGGMIEFYERREIPSTRPVRAAPAPPPTNHDRKKIAQPWENFK